MLGFDSLGRLALGQLPGTSVVSVFISSKVSSICALRVSISSSSAITGRSTGALKISAPLSPTSALSAKAEAMLRAAAPGGLILKGKMGAMAKAKATPGYLLFAKAAMASSGLSDIHMEGTTSGPRDPLLLNSGSEFIASYWKGRS